MAIETLLLLAGSPAVAAAIAITAYALVSRRKRASSVQVTQSDESQLVISHEESASKPFTSVDHAPSNSPTQVLPIPAVNAANVPVASAPLQEAPAPFPEEVNPTSSTSTPTDVTALVNMTSPMQGASPTVLVIPRPKRRSRAKRLPGETPSVAPRKRRSTRSKSIVPEATFTETQPSFAETTSSGSAGQQQE